MSTDVIHLRDFKRYVAQMNGKSVQTCARHYLEYAPCGTLEGLIMRYRAFNRYFPELFLWHVFNSLARATCELEESELVLAQQGRYVLHRDIKPANIFLEYEQNDRIGQTGGLNDTNIYPTIKLADFRLARQADPRDIARPPKDWYISGTSDYYPPVSPTVQYVAQNELTFS